MFKIGDKIISIKVCGYSRSVPVGVKGIIVDICSDGDIFCDFDNIEGTKSAGNTNFPKIELDVYLTKINIKKEIDDILG